MPKRSKGKKYKTCAICESDEVSCTGGDYTKNEPCERCRENGIDCNWKKRHKKRKRKRKSRKDKSKLKDHSMVERTMTLDSDDESEVINYSYVKRGKWYVTSSEEDDFGGESVLEKVVGEMDRERISDTDYDDFGSVIGVIRQHSNDEDMSDDINDFNGFSSGSIYSIIEEVNKEEMENGSDDKDIIEKDNTDDMLDEMMNTDIYEDSLEMMDVSMPSDSTFLDESFLREQEERKNGVDIEVLLESLDDMQRDTLMFILRDDAILDHFDCLFYCVK